MKIPLITFSTGLALGLFFCFLFHSMPASRAGIPTINKCHATHKKKVASSELPYTKKYDSLKKQNEGYAVAISKSKKALQVASQIKHDLQGQAKDLLTKTKVSSDSTSNSDSACFRLKLIITDLMESSIQSDSLYASVIFSLEKQGRIKDSTIFLQDEQYKKIKEAFEESIKKSEELEAQNKQLAKTARRQKFKSKVLSALLLIFSGAATNHLIRH